MNITSMLTQIEALIKNYFGEALIWDEKSGGLRGKYFYTNFKGTQTGIFLGFLMNSDLVNPKKCVVFVFGDPKCRLTRDLARETEKLLIQLKEGIVRKGVHKINFTLVKQDLPSLVSTIDIGKDDNEAIKFFEESLLLFVQTGLSTRAS